MYEFTPSERFTAQLQRHEGFYPAPYLCTAGACTVGYGTNLDAHPKYIPFDGIRAQAQAGKLKGKSLMQALRMQDFTVTKSRALEMMLDEVMACHGDLMIRCKEYAALRFAADPGMDGAGPRADVLLNMAFNIGVDGLMKFKQTLYYIGNRDYDAAAMQLKKSAWFRQVGDGEGGYFDRAEELCQQMRTGRYSATREK